MLFNSISFLIFLPIVFVIYWLLKDKLKLQNIFVITASYIFYGWWDWRFLILIIITTFCSYLSGILLEKYEGQRHKQKVVSACNILLNIGILGTFKYFNFFTENFAALFKSLGMSMDMPTVKLILPVGISFYTFQALSYTIDVYQHKIKPTHNVPAFFAFISFFPQLVAGPIERATHLLPQFLEKRKFDYASAVDGCRQILWGFFKKVVIADACALIVNNIFCDPELQCPLTLIPGALLFTIQIYCDFSGYSDIAIGTARLFGINLMQNFAFPYFSRNISEFWRRWHISLSTWFRDYVYFPLGGSRCNKWRTLYNTLILFTVSGFWHGANWTFICWGAYHGLLFIPFIVFGRKKYKDVVAKWKRLPSVTEIFQMAITFFFVVIGWIMFRADSLQQFVVYIKNMFNPRIINFHNYGLTDTPSLYVFIFILLLTEWIQREHQHGLSDLNRFKLLSKAVPRYCLYLCILFVIWVFKATASDFIYFQF